MNLDRLIREKKLVICVGSGGVGKTTTAAAIGIQAAQTGRRVLVLTIDPARRLANALGLSSIGNEESPITVPDLPPGGSLHALMLDTQHTFDDLIARTAPDEETRDRIYANSIYRIISESFAGSQEYMATEKLYDVYVSGRYDLIVLDTPPANNAIDFIESPGRLSRFVDRRIMKWFLTPYDESKVFGRVLVGTSGVVFRLLALIFGREFLSELATFLNAFRDLTEGFHQRHQAVLTLFSDTTTSFIVVCATNETSVEVASFFRDELATRGLPFDGVIVNQVYRCTDRSISAAGLLGGAARDLAGDLESHTAASLLARLEMAHRRLRAVARQERTLMDRIKGLTQHRGFEVRVPRLETPVRDLGGLLDLNRYLFPS